MSMYARTLVLLCVAECREQLSSVLLGDVCLGSVVLLNVVGCRLIGTSETNAEAWFNIALRPRKPEGSLGRTAQDVHLDSHAAPEV